MTWTGQSFTVGQVLTAAQMNNLQADITALANNDSGSPSVISAVGASLVFISETDISSDAQIDFTSGLDSTYDEYVFVFVNVRPVTDAVKLYMRMSIASVWQTGTSSYGYVNSEKAATSTAGDTTGNIVGDGASPQIHLINGPTAPSAATIGNGLSETLSGEIRIFNPAGTVDYTKIRSQFAWGSNNNYAGHTVGSSVLRSTSAADGVRFYFSSGNLNTGKIRMYGVRKL